MRKEKSQGRTILYGRGIYKPGTNSQAKRELIFNKTGMISAIYNNGTHYVANHRLTSEMLEQICKDEDVIEVTGEYTGGKTRLFQIRKRKRTENQPFYRGFMTPGQRGLVQAI
jgi:hypothetical protein